MKKTCAIILAVFIFLTASCSIVFAESEHNETDSEAAMSEKIEVGEETISLLFAYMTDEVEVPSERAEGYLAQFKNHPDICLEFEQWVKTREFNFENPITVEGYSASDIAEMAPFLSGLGVYNFLVSLREETEYALLIIKMGFPVA